MVLVRFGGSEGPILEERRGGSVRQRPRGLLANGKRANVPSRGRGIQKTENNSIEVKAG